MCSLYLCSQSPLMESPSRFSKAVWQSSKFPCFPREASRCCWVACWKQQELKMAFLQQIVEISYCVCVRVRVCGFLPLEYQKRWQKRGKFSIWDCFLEPKPSDLWELHDRLCAVLPRNVWFNLVGENLLYQRLS